MKPADQMAIYLTTSDETVHTLVLAYDDQGHILGCDIGGQQLLSYSMDLGCTATEGRTLVPYRTLVADGARYLALGTASHTTVDTKFTRPCPSIRISQATKQLRSDCSKSCYRHAIVAMATLGEETSVRPLMRRSYTSLYLMRLNDANQAYLFDTFDPTALELVTDRNGQAGWLVPDSWL